MWTVLTAVWSVSYCASQWKKISPNSSTTQYLQILQSTQLPNASIVQTLRVIDAVIINKANYNTMQHKHFVLCTVDDCWVKSNYSHSVWLCKTGRISWYQENSYRSSWERLEKTNRTSAHLLVGHYEERPIIPQPQCGRCHRAGTGQATVKVIGSKCS